MCVNLQGAEKVKLNNSQCFSDEGSKYISKYLTHFVGGEDSEDEDRYSLLKHIIHEGELLPPTYVEARRQKIEGQPREITDRVTIDEKRRSISVINNLTLSSNKKYLPNVVCFCDIHQGSFGIHMSKYGEFGLSFSKEFMVRQGASPVFYIERNSMSSEVIGDKPLFERFDEGEMDLIKGIRGSLSTEDAWRAESFLAFSIFGFCKFFDSSLDENNPDNLYYEREWRVWGSVGFELDDISIAIVPSKFTERLLADFPSLQGRIVAAEDCVEGKS